MSPGWWPRVWISEQATTCDTDVSQECSFGCSTFGSFPANIPGKPAEGDPNAWAPANHGVDPGGTRGFWLQSGPILATVAIWGVKQQTEDLSFSLSLLPTLPSQ